jgi:flagellar hook-associated protein FlgK
MASVLPIALSGMNAAQLSLQASAHNIANLGTEGFRREQVVQSEAPNGAGVDAALTRSSASGSAIETDLVGLLQGKNAFLANLAVFRASDRMHGALLDIAA